MTAKYDIFKKTPENDFVWVEAVEDIVAAKKRLISLASIVPTEYRLKHTQKAFLVLAAVAIILAILVFLATVADGVVNVVDQPLAV